MKTVVKKIDPRDINIVINDKNINRIYNLIREYANKFGKTIKRRHYIRIARDILRRKRKFVSLYLVNKAAEYYASKNIIKALKFLLKKKCIPSKAIFKKIVINKDNKDKLADLIGKYASTKPPHSRNMWMNISYNIRNERIKRIELYVLLKAARRVLKGV